MKNSSFVSFLIPQFSCFLSLFLNQEPCEFYPTFSSLFSPLIIPPKSTFFLILLVKTFLRPKLKPLRNKHRGKSYTEEEKGKNYRTNFQLSITLILHDSTHKLILRGPARLHHLHVLFDGVQSRAESTTAN